MKQYAKLAQFGNTYFRKSLAASIIVHALVVLIAIYAPMLPILKSKRGGMKFHTTVRVDIIELPEEVLSQMDNPIVSTHDAIKALRKKITSSYSDPNALKFQTKDAINRLKAKSQSAIERLKTLQAISNLKRKQKKKVQKQGNIITEGAETASANQEGETLGAYASMIHDRVKLRWALPFYLRQQENLSGRLLVFLDSDGSVMRTKVTGSGNPDFDRNMNQALEEAKPFPEVPESAQKDIRYDGIDIEFLAKELL